MEEFEPGMGGERGTDGSSRTNRNMETHRESGTNGNKNSMNSRETEAQSRGLAKRVVQASAPHGHAKRDVQAPASRSVAKRVVQAPIRFYRSVLSPLKPPTCRFYPTCSAYALEAVEVHGPLKGSILAAIRIAKCQPFHPGGLDPVPPPGRWRPEREQE